MAALAIRTTEQVADAQCARNATFPDATESPVIGILLLSVTAALDHLLLFPDNPMRAFSLTLVQMLCLLGPMASESVSALAENDFTWTEGTEHPTVTEVNDALDSLRRELEINKDHMVQWRLHLPYEQGIRFDRRLHSATLAIEEMRYYDNFTALTLVQTVLKAYQWHMQMALVEHKRDRTQARVPDGQHAQ